MSSVIFITGTDTGAGKTILTGLLLEWFLRRRTLAVAWKPFSSGGREDAELFSALMQRGNAHETALSLDQINPFAFQEPVTPLLAARLGHHPAIKLEEVTARLTELRKLADVVLVEGAGGLLSPLGEGFSARELIREWRCPVLVAASNRLGVVNQARLTVEALQVAGVARMALALSDTAFPDASSKWNSVLIRDHLPGLPVVGIPFLGNDEEAVGLVRRGVDRLDSELGMLAGALLDQG